MTGLVLRPCLSCTHVDAVVSSLVAPQTHSSDCRAHIEYPDSRKFSQPSHQALFSEHPVFAVKMGE